MRAGGAVYVGLLIGKSKSLASSTLPSTSVSPSAAPASAPGTTAGDAPAPAAAAGAQAGTPSAASAAGAIAGAGMGGGGVPAGAAPAAGTNTGSTAAMAPPLMVPCEAYFEGVTMVGNACGGGPGGAVALVACTAYVTGRSYFGANVAGACVCARGCACTVCACRHVLV